jgi:diaminopimelate decarboxylase
MLFFFYPMSNFPALLHPIVANLLNHHQNVVQALSRVHHGPIHLLFPQVFAENCLQYQNKLKELEIPHKLLFACKANKSATFIEMCSSLGLGTDVSSVFELHNALSKGIGGESISVSAPAKDEVFLSLACRVGATIAVESIDELKLLLRLIDQSRPAVLTKIMLRVAVQQAKSTRFGFTTDEISQAAQILRSNQDHLCFEGLSFHLNDYEPENRAVAISDTLSLLIELREILGNGSMINIGGGFTVRYVTKETWHKFKATNGTVSNFGKRAIADYYPYFSEHAGPEFLSKILSCSTHTGMTVKELLQRNAITLCLEPGRSLLDQAGISVFRVLATKYQSRHRDNLAVLNGNFNHLSEQWFNTDFLPDPILIQGDNRSMRSSGTVSFAGNTCMEADMLTWRQVSFDQLPLPGDLIVYPNTAGYQMDSNESTFHHIPIPPKFAVFVEEDKWQCIQDEDFSVLDLKHKTSIKLG